MQDAAAMSEWAPCGWKAGGEEEQAWLEIPCQCKWLEQVYIKLWRRKHGELERRLSPSRKIVLRNVLTFPVSASNEEWSEGDSDIDIDLPEWLKAQNMAFYSAGWCVCMCLWWEWVGEGVTCSLLTCPISYMLSLAHWLLSSRIEIGCAPWGCSDCHLGGSRKPPAQSWHLVFVLTHRYALELGKTTSDCQHFHNVVLEWGQNSFNLLGSDCIPGTGLVLCMHYSQSILNQTDRNNCTGSVLLVWKLKFTGIIRFAQGQSSISLAPRVVAVHFCIIQYGLPLCSPLLLGDMRKLSSCCFISHACEILGSSSSSSSPVLELSGASSPSVAPSRAFLCSV